MKELLRSNLGKKAVKAMIWGLVGYAIAAAGSGLLFLVIEVGHINNIEGVFVFLYGMFYCLGFASIYLFLGSLITLLVMIIVKYSKRRFCKKIN